MLHNPHSHSQFNLTVELLIRVSPSNVYTVGNASLPNCIAAVRDFYSKFCEKCKIQVYESKVV